MKKEKPLVLIVDDEEQMRMLVRASLEQAEFQVEEACDGTQALTAFELFKPEIILMDVMMPGGIDGFTACKNLKALPGGEKVPILMMTALDDLQSINKAYDAGATDFFTKPINWTILGHRVRYMLRTSRAADRLRMSEARNSSLVNAVPDLMFRVKSDGTILDYVPAKETGQFLDTTVPIGSNLHEIFPDIAKGTMRYTKQALETGQTHTFEYTIVMNDSTLHYEARVVVSGEDETLTIVRDITDRKEAEEHIKFLAYYDTLTGLPNRLYFKEKLSEALQRAARYDQEVAILFLDLDDFKRINDTLGHTIGDMLLKGVAERLDHCLRKTDSITHLDGPELNSNVSRLGGDEFIVQLTEVSLVHDLAKVAMRILSEIASPFTLEGFEVFITASIGITLYPSNGDNVDTLMKNADTAMYHAKDKGKNNYQFYNQSMNDTAFERLSMENDIRRAMERKELTLFYQPQMHIESGKIRGFEALIRWKHPEFGYISPNDFIPLAEEIGLIIPIGEWVLKSACVQVMKWSEDGFEPVSVAVNISSHQFRQGNLKKKISKILNETSMDPSYLKLELTESVIMTNLDETMTTLHDLKSMGIGLIIDDFGTGYSSLSYLKRFPIDALKIDKSFIKDLTVDKDDAAMTKTIITMAQNLNLKVVAEGIETEEQLAFLKENGCDEIQGYLYAPPMPADEVKDFLQKKQLNSCKGA